MSEYSNLSVLIIDPNVGMRGSLHNMLNLSEITKIDYAVSSGTAIRQIAKKQYDIILCEYDLGSAQDGQDGQQLLEDLRHHKLIGQWTIFIMITSESVYSKVVSAAELAPTAYVLKPFTVDVLIQRIARAIERRKAFLPVFQLIGQGETQAAIKATLSAEQAQPRHAADFARLRAELQLSLGEAREAGLTYQKIIEERPVVWAQLGLAKTQFAQGRYADAAASLNELIASNPKLMDAYDWLAKTYEAMEHPEQAKETLEAAVAISPHVVRRLRHLGEVALNAGDPDAAERTFKQVVAKAKYSEFRDPEDHVNLVRALLDKNNPTMAAGVIRDLEKSLRGNPKLEACRALSNALMYSKAGNTPVAATELHAALEANRAGVGLSGPMKLVLARNCIEQQLDDAAGEVMQEVINDATNGVSTEQALRVFEQAGRADLARGFGDKVKLQVESLLAQAEHRMEARDYRGAVLSVTEAQRKAPSDARVAGRAITTVITCMDHTGWDNALGDQTQQLIDKLRSIQPDSAQLSELQARFQACQRNYGINA